MQRNLIQITAINFFLIKNIKKIRRAILLNNCLM